ncbi:MAG: hypothetical protein AAFQ78_03680, partial [Bacteroidota bacterium]
HHALIKVLQVSPDKVNPKDEHGLYHRLMQKIDCVSSADHYPFVYQAELLKQSLTRLTQPEKLTVWEGLSRAYQGVKGTIQVAQGLAGVLMLRLDFDSIEQGVGSLYKAFQPLVKGHPGAASQQVDTKALGKGLSSIDGGIKKLEKGIESAQTIYNTARVFTAWVKSIRAWDDGTWYDALNGLGCAAVRTLADPREYGVFAQGFSLLLDKATTMKNPAMQRALRHGLVTQLTLLASQGSSEVQPRAQAKLTELLQKSEQDWPAAHRVVILQGLARVVVLKAAGHQQVRQQLEQWSQEAKQQQDHLGRRQPQAKQYGLCQAWLGEQDLATYLRQLKARSAAEQITQPGVRLYRAVRSETKPQGAEVNVLLIFWSRAVLPTKKPIPAGAGST